MVRIITALLFLIFTATVSADKAVIGYYQQMGPYNDHVIVYTYYKEDGTIGVSHCRTLNRANLNDAFLKQETLNINTCDLSYTTPTLTPTQEF